MAESVMTYLVQQQGLSNQFVIESAATSTEEIGNGIHIGTRRKLEQVGIPIVPHRAVQMRKSDYSKYDFLIGMDSANIRNMTRIAGGDPEHKIRLLLEWGDRLRDIADPWYTGNFDATYRDIVEGCEGFLRDYLNNSLV